MTITERDERARSTSLYDLPMMRLLTKQLQELIVGSFAERSYGFGEYLVVEGEPGDAFYVLTEGMARVIRKGPDGRDVTIDIMGPGESFGEASLLADVRRNSSVRASEPTAAVRLDAAVFQSLVRLHPQIEELFRRQGRARRLQGFLAQHPAFARLSPDKVAMLIQSGREVSFAAGQAVVTAGDDADRWWVVEDGRLTVFEGVAATRRNLRYLRTGDIFGEMALVLGGTRTASIEATSDVRSLEFPREAFAALREDPTFNARIEERAAMYARAAARVPLDFPELQAGPSPGVDAETSAEPAADDADESVAEGVDLAESVEPAPAWSPPRRFPVVRQIDEADCGAASVAMLCRAFGHHVSLSYIRHAVGTGQSGTRLSGIVRGGDQIGLDVTALKSSARRIGTLPLPAIIHWGGNHWVVLYAVESDRVRIADPARGLRTFGMEEVAEKWSGYVATARPTPRLAEAPRERLQIRWLMPFFAPHRGRLVVSCVAALVAAGFQMLPPVLSQNVINAVTGHRGAGRVDLFVAIMFAVLVLSAGASLLQRRLLARIAVDLDSDTLDFVTGRLLNLPLSYFETRRTGDIERRLNGLRQLRQLMVQNVPGALAAAVQLLVTLVIMFAFSWVIGVAFLATMPLYAALMRVSATRLRPTFDSLEEAYGRHSSKQIDAIKGIEAVKTAGAEPGIRNRILDEFKRLADKVFHADFVLMSYTAAVSLVGFLIFVLFLWLAALLAINHQITIGGVVAINSLVLLANAPIMILLNTWDQMQIASVLLQRLQDVLEQEPEQPSDGAGLRPVPTLSGRLELRRVGQFYRDTPDRPVLEDVSFTLEPGMSLGLVGRSGSGKSTLLRCLSGLLVPTSGTILYDGVDLRELRWSELRRRIGFVLQEPYLFDDTVAANIALGDDQPDWNRVRRAAEVAAAAEFIEELALGYMTRVGDSGLRLSGGQAQRVAIARALYHEPPVVLFDEATSALDTESERAVKENLDRVMAERTTVIVAHRLSTVRDADVIGVLDHGRLVEWGNHEQLMAREGLYFHLNMVQVQA
ncbi:MAG: peptidase domain-containing ABC transporter [Solirubrobacterales bacterium]|nr:peptidase domain-containing ABC transporter [Solirubrobacterales bacterium]